MHVTLAGHADPPASTRILSAARTLVVRGGAAMISMGDVAAEARVSKALVHYHFRDKDSLLLALVDQIGAAVAERSATAISANATGHVLDEYWEWLRAELDAGDVRALISLADCESERVRTASRRVVAIRRDASAQHVAQIFASLSLTPRVPTEIIAESVLAFIDGLAVRYALEPARNARPAFDVFWLAMLTFAE